MVELTTSTIIKIALGVFVLVIIITTAYMGARHIKDYFNGYNFNSSSGVVVGGGADVCRGKTVLGNLRKEGKYLFFYDKTPKKTNIYFDNEGNIWYLKKVHLLIGSIDFISPDKKIGRIRGMHIEIYNEYNNQKYFPADRINNAKIGGNEVC